MAFKMEWSFLLFLSSPQFVFAQKNIVLRKDLLPLPQKGLLAKHVVSYCPPILQGCSLCHQIWELSFEVSLRAVTGQAARIPVMRSI